MTMASATAPWWRRALHEGMQATCLWRAVRDDAGQVVDLEVVECDDGFADWFARPIAALPGTRYSELVPSGIRDRLSTYIAVLDDGQARDLVFAPVPKLGRPDVAEVRLVPCGDDLIWAEVADVTERERHLRAVMLERDAAAAGLQQLVRALNASPDAFAVHEARRDVAGEVTGFEVAFVNEAASSPTGRPAEAWRDLDIREWFPEVVDTGLFDAMRSVVDTQEPSLARLVIDSVRGWHGTYDVRLTPFGADFVLATWHEAPDGEPGRFGVVPSLDRLTGLPGTDEFLRHMRELGDLDGHALLCLDLDGFGSVNDRIGRHRADRVLTSVAAALGALAPMPRIRARTGHDEFAIVIPADDPRALDEVHGRLERVVAEIGATAGIPRLRASVGARWLATGDLPVAALHDCDAALRAARSVGGGALTVFSSALAAERARIAVVAEDIAAALRNDAFDVAYQRIVHAASGQRWGVEALARWRHDEVGLLMPAEFIPAAEASGRIIDLGAVIIDRVVADLAAHPQVPHATVNVSAVQLLSSDVTAVVARALEQHVVDASRLFLEITESALLVDSERVRGELRALRAIGVRIAIDDFGTGYSSIAYLDRIPFDIAKFDAYFLDGHLDWRRRSLIASAASMVRSLGAMSLAEHVETEEQALLVHDAGIDLAQGFHFGRPEFGLR